MLLFGTLLGIPNYLSSIFDDLYILRLNNAIVNRPMAAMSQVPGSGMGAVGGTTLGGEYPQNIGAAGSSGYGTME
jgi:hypothetical protein